MKKLLILFFAILSVFCVAFGFSACGDNSDKGHVHEWSAQWAYDETHHWRVCGGCEEKDSYAVHDFSDGDCLCGKAIPFENFLSEYKAEAENFINKKVKPIVAADKDIKAESWFVGENAEDGTIEITAVLIYALQDTDCAVEFVKTVLNSSVTPGKIIDGTAQLSSSDCTITRETAMQFDAQINIEKRKLVNAIYDTCNCENSTIKVICEVLYENPNYRCFYFAVTKDEGLAIRSVIVEKGNGSDNAVLDNLEDKYSRSFRTLTTYEINGDKIISNAYTPDIIQFDGHNLLYVSAVQPNCTEGGNNAYYQCSDCGKYFADVYPFTEIEDNSSVILKARHTLTKTDALKATCTESGNVEYYTCSVCKKCFSDCDGENEITDQSELNVDRLGHDFSEKIIYDETQHWYPCVRCGMRKSMDKHDLVKNKCVKCKYIPQSITYKLNSDGESYSVTKYGLYSDTVISAEYCGKPVTIIGDGAFKNSTTLTSVIIPDSITHIYESAFEGCTNLKNVTIPDSVTLLDSYVFRECTKLTDVVIGNGVTSIGMSTFWGCKSLKSITIPDSVKIIDAWAFGNCSNLDRIVIGSGVTKIDSSAFNGIFGISKYYTIYYKGTSEEWGAIEDGAHYLSTHASWMLYYSEFEPNKRGYYWHYVDGVVTAWPYVN